MKLFGLTGALTWVLRFVIGMALVLTAISCGGGGSKTPIDTKPKEIGVVAFLGDSLTNGGFYGGQRLAVSPVDRMTAYAAGRWTGLNMAVDGMQCVNHPAPPLDAHAYVFRFGMADQVKGSVREVVNACLNDAVKALKEAGKTVYLVGVIHVPDPAQNAILAQWDADQKAIAKALDVVFIDVRALGQVSMNDDIHPDQAGSDRISRLIADTIL